MRREQLPNSTTPKTQVCSQEEKDARRTGHSDAGGVMGTKKQARETRGAIIYIYMYRTRCEVLGVIGGLLLRTSGRCEVGGYEKTKGETSLSCHVA